MKLLFFSRDSLEVEHARRALDEAGIPCEVRHGFSAPGLPTDASSMELWLRNEHDVSRALMRCAEMELGFYRRPGKPLVAIRPPVHEDEDEHEEKGPPDEEISGAA